MAKYYFNSDNPEYCYDLEYWKDYMKDWFLTELKLIEAKPDYGSGYFNCTHPDIGDIGEVGHSDCGRLCSAYQPRNGKNGRCVNSGYCYEPKGKVRILKMK